VGLGIFITGAAQPFKRKRRKRTKREKRVKDEEEDFVNIIKLLRLRVHLDERELMVIYEN